MPHTEQHDILILSSQSERAANLSFLLRLSNFNSLHIADDIEAFNYLVQRCASGKPLDLLLVADADLNQPILHLLDELERRGALLPILLLRGNGPIPMEQLGLSDRARAHIKQCEPSIIHACVREILGNKSDSAALAS